MPPVHHAKIGGCPLCGGCHLQSRYPKRYTIYQCLKCGYRTKKFRDSTRRVRIPPELRPFVKRVKSGKAWATWWPGRLTNPIIKPRKDWGIPWMLITPVVIHGKLNWRRTDYVPRAAGNSCPIGLPENLTAVFNECSSRLWLEVLTWNLAGHLWSSSSSAASTGSLMGIAE